MASHFITLSRATPRSALIPPPQTKIPLILLNFTDRTRGNGRARGRSLRIVRVSDGRDSSYLDMWKKAVDRERDEIEFQKIVDNSGKISETEESVDPDALAQKSNEFQKILEVSKEERDRVQRMQVIDRAAAAIAAARALLKDTNLRKEEGEGEGEGGPGINNLKSENKEGMGDQQEAMKSGSSFVSQSVTSSKATPGPDFWAWTPPESDRISDDIVDATQAKMPSPYPTTVKPVMEKERYVDTLSIPFESKFPETNPPLPPLQSFMEVENVDISTSSLETPSSQEEHELGVQFSAHAAEAVRVLNKVDEASSYGVYPNGSRWWKETGIERRPDGVVCKWTLTRGVSADQGVEWEEKFWEAADKFQYKELGSEKSGRDATGNVWREYWKESMFQDHGIMNLEKTADKWGKNGKGDEWHEKWWEHYDASGKADKWADKWSSIDPNTPLEAGHAHVWHERWGEKYDGFGGSVKYTDKWAERSEGDGWTKWGDKWDENFNVNGHGVKQGETWWEGKYGERWNRTWGEGHNGSGWVHKYGKSSSGEHWDTHEEQETWYERYPHFGFMHCFDNSVQLREVRKPSETETS